MAIVLLLIYANVGLATAINIHFCNGHLAKVSLAKINFRSACCCETENMEKDCCKDEVVLVKSDNHQSQTSLVVPESGFKILSMLAVVLQDETSYYLQNYKKLPSSLRLRNPHITDIFLAIHSLRI